MNKPNRHPLPPPETTSRKGWPWEEPQEAPPISRSFSSPPPRITIVTPSYNQAPYLEETIRSVLAQRYPNLEYIILDGGSTDGSVKLIEKYSPWLSYWTSEKDGGQSDAINKGLSRSTGTIFAWLNSDDSYQCDSLWQAASFFESQPQTGLVYGPCNIIDRDSAVIGRRRAPDVNLLLMLRACSNLIPSPSTFFCTQAVRSVGGISQDLHYTMDYELCVRMLLQNHGGACSQELTANLRVHELAKSSTGPEKGILEMISILEGIRHDPQTPAEIKAACLEGIALACVRGSITAANSGRMLRAITWRFTSIVRALSALRHVGRPGRTHLLSLLLPAQLCPALRRFRLDNHLDLTNPS